MVVLRCTAKLLKRLKMEKEPLKDPGPSTTALGDWYANIVYVQRRPLVLTVSEKSLLPLLMPARDLDQLPGHLMRALVERVQRMGLPDTVLQQEISRMEPFIYGKTASRSILGSMNDFADNLKYIPGIHSDWGLVDMIDWLGDMPCGSIGYKYPSERARELLMENSLKILN